ncbi:MAG TPA: hypothetical protein VFT50_11045 [Baekduia sp.]|nr:hypothetical protein [Baekduia sp.]
MAEIQVGDVVLARGTAGQFHAIVAGVRLGRLMVERCDGRPAGPLSPRDVVTVYKPAGAPEAEPRTPRLRPTAQLRLDLAD